MTRSKLLLLTLVAAAGTPALLHLVSLLNQLKTLTQ